MTERQLKTAENWTTAKRRFRELLIVGLVASHGLVWIAGYAEGRSDNPTRTAAMTEAR